MTMATAQPDVDVIQGYEAVFDPEVDRKYLCPVCLAALRDAMQTSCGHRFCKPCIQGVVNGRSFAKCPVDNMWFRCEDEIFEDNAVRREVLSLTVKCNFHVSACQWKGELRELQNHLNDCPYFPLPCHNDCGMTVQRQALTGHLVICERRLVQCQHCQVQVIYADLIKHQVLMCHKFPVRCTLCGQFGICREDIPQHIDKEVGTCPQAMVDCQYVLYGCKFQDSRHMMPEHYKEASHHHLALVLGEVKTTKQKLDSVMDTVENLQQQVMSRDRQIKDLSQRLSEQMETLSEHSQTSYNGTFHWKIPMSDLRVEQFLSKSFYTGCPGYQVCVCLEVRGHKEGNESYASFFVILEKGVHDDNLRFPFNSACHVTVHDQSESNNVSHHNAVIHCTNVPRCLSEEQLSNSRRGRLRFMKTDELLSDRFIADGYLYMDIAVNHCVPNNAGF